ncbi:sensor histidine kinase [Sandaracinus amylolyticus]|uniref:sensor histidine kinase n=1 Tax=Sandaracinus amylolyticus TaxID=927083 RepID=UPI001F278AD7|nr:HAMP domain-containing sensor histidine kinase [Sandaracinus amylolyticus]UJR82203.1 Hypothetical protein I5071_42680 [Sandaracinus amylolyticus]
MSVRTRVVLAFAVFALPAIALVLWGTWSTRRQAALEATREAIVARMEDGGGRARCEADPTRFTLGRRHHGRRHRGPLIEHGRVEAYDASFTPAHPHAPRLDPEVRDALESSDLGIVEIEGERRRDGALAVRMPWDEGPCVVLVIETPGARPALGQRILRRDLAGSAAVLGLALVVALIALGPPLARLRRLAKAVRASDGIGFTVPHGVAGTDEIGRVARALDDASQRVRDHVARLEERDRALTAYVDATTHDLAIPLTVIQSRLAELDARVRAGERIEPSALEPLLAEHEYLGQLVSNMAAAARFASGQPHVEKHAVDLRALVERVAARHAPLARAQGVVLEHAVPSRAVTIEGDDILVERALSNLVHNAIRHGASRRGGREGHVALTLDARPQGGFRIAVADDGEHADVARIERVLRGPIERGEGNARARGLGLRIVRAVADAHHWSIEVEPHEEGGTVITITGR